MLHAIAAATKGMALNTQLPAPLQDVPRGQTPDAIIPLDSYKMSHCNDLPAPSAAAITCGLIILSKQEACHGHIKAIVAAVITSEKWLLPQPG